MVFIQFYDNLLRSQEIEVSDFKLERMKILIDQLIEKKIARYFVTVDKFGRFTYATIFTIHNNKGCYLFGAGDKDKMQRYDGTFCIWEAMKMLSRSGVHIIDLEGVNSPERGRFKLGFGGNLKKYYHVSKNNPEEKK